MSTANVGKVVTWAATYRGGMVGIEHTGAIVAFVPVGVDLIGTWHALNPGAWCPMAAQGATYFDRYIVRVDRVSARGPLKPRWYAPRASVIDRALAAQGQSEKEADHG